MLIIKWLTQKNNVQKLLYSQYNQVLEGSMAVLINCLVSALPFVAVFDHMCVCLTFTFITCPGNLRLNTMLCWPRLVSTTTVETTSSWAQPAANTTGCAHWLSSTLVSTHFCCETYLH